MGIIKDEVKHAHLTQYPHEEYLISSLTNDFNINWARRRKAFGCELSAYILGPENSIIESFGLDREVLMVIVEYDGLQARVMQAINQFFGDHPFNGRTDSTVFVMIVRSNKERDWVESYVTENPESRIPVIFTYDDIESARHDAWKIRNILSRYLYFRDLFHYTLPLDNDRFFFGREQQVNDLTDSIRKSDNVGLFGLRKTGKTSILFKLTRLARRTKDLEVIYYDCKFPGIRSSHWSDFLDRIVRDISCISKNIKEPDSSKGHASDRFLEILKQVPKRMSICIVFDEIEFISPLNDRDPHWSKEFVDLWQTLWSAQSIHRKLSFIVAGVSPTIVERDRIDNVHNPVFGIVRPIFLTGFRRDEVTQMLRSFGKRMGLRFSDDAKDYLLDRYGGHPLLTRMACSFVHQKLMLEGYERPVTISFTWLEETQKERDADIRFYCNHVVSELKDFYPEEYEMLEMLATRNYVDFREFAQDPEFTSGSNLTFGAHASPLR